MLEVIETDGEVAITVESTASRALCMSCGVRSWPRRVALAAFLTVVLAACSGSDNSSEAGGEALQNPPGSGAVASDVPATSPPGAPVVLKAPVGTDATSIQVAADAVRTRLDRMHVPWTSVTAQSDGVGVASLADPFQLEAVARQHATMIAPIATTAVGPCKGSGNASIGPAARCYTLGAPLTGVAAVTDASPQASSGGGWRVTFSIDPMQYQGFRAAIDAAGRRPLALVNGADVLLAFDPTVPALHSQLGPALTEDQARRVAAALTVDGDLPVALEAPATPAPQVARVNLDFWTAALGVNICGTWLANAPPAGLDTGVHSHGDGLIYVHPFDADEAGGRATLGLFLERGAWKATQEALELWDGDEHRNGDPCPGGGPAAVRWWVDGVEQQGNPSDFVPKNGQVIVLGFGDDAGSPGSPPQQAALYLPSLAAAAS